MTTTTTAPARSPDDSGAVARGQQALHRRGVARAGRRRDRGNDARLRADRADPAWVRPALVTLLVATGMLFLWNLGASGNANSYYAAAVQAGTQSWKAFFFGSLDAANAITVDKTPASLWVMELSGRIFGFNSWSMLAPQALEGVAAVGLLYAAVRRWAGPAAGLLAGASLALTPVATLMFRFNNPDALLTLLLVAGAYCTVRAVERAGTRWLMLVGLAIGFAFLAKMLQAFLVVPAFALVYLIAAPTPLRRRLLQLLAAGVAMIASAGWWVAIVELWPASSRPYIGGSTTNSVLELALGYNGLSRIVGDTAGGGAGNNTGFGGATGWLRMFGDSFGTQISWLLPAALLAMGIGLWRTRSAPRTDRLRAAVILWGTWLLVTAGVFSFMSGTVHSYYAVALAPAICALVATVGAHLWAARDSWTARAALASMVAVTGGWSWVLLGRAASWHPELRYAVLLVTVVAVAALVVTGRRLVLASAGALMAALLVGSGSAAYSLQTASTTHNGSIPTAGPSSSMNGFGGGSGGPGGGGAPNSTTTTTSPSGTSTAGAGTASTGTASTGTASTGTASTSTAATGSTSGQQGGAPGGQEASTEVVALLEKTTTTWAAATVGAQSAASLELATGKAVIAIGGFTGNDPSPTLAEFEQYVAAGKIHYLVVGGSGAGGGGQSTGQASQILAWVAAHYSATTVGSQTVYDLTSATTG